MENRSELAVWSPARRKRWRKIEPWGLLVHTSGRGIVARALKQRIPPIVLALSWYQRKSGVHYVVGYDGVVYQMLADDRRGAHVGVSVMQRRSYLSGRWMDAPGIRDRAVALWRERWPGIESPQHLYPTRSPNSCYIGIEMVPLTEADCDGLWFTDAQHRAVAALADDLAERHDWPANWKETPRLLGHEDVSPLTRWDNQGGWDPGALRPRPRISWSMICGARTGQRTS